MGQNKEELSIPLLSVEDLTVSYGPIVALRNLSFKVTRGEIVTLLGANGAGKSTTLKSIMGLLHNKKGSIYFQGENILNEQTEQIVRRGLSMIPEGRHIFPQLTVVENLRLGAAVRNDREQVNNDFEMVYDLFPILRERRNMMARTLSGGQQQMLVIGRALMSKPALLLLDEPSLGLAPQVVDKIFELLGRLNESGMTMLLVEQYVEGALNLAHRAYVLQTGKIVLSGRADEIKQEKELKRAFLGIGVKGKEN